MTTCLISMFRDVGLVNAQSGVSSTVQTLFTEIRYFETARLKCRSKRDYPLSVQERYLDVVRTARLRTN